MQIISNKRQTTPLRAGEIEVVPGTMADAPRRIMEAEAVPALRKASQRATALAAEIAEKNAELQAERNKAVEIQMAHDELHERRRTLLASINQCEAELASCKGRLIDIDREARACWQGGVSDHALEATRRQFMVDRLPGWIESSKADLAEIDSQIADFNRNNN